MNRHCLSYILLLLLLASTSKADEESTQIQYELQVFRLDGAFRSKMSLSAKIRKADEEALQKLGDDVTLFNEGEFAWGKQRLQLNSKGCFWKGKKLTFEEGYREKLPDDKVKMIYSPSVVRPIGDLVRLKIESDTPFQFMQRREDGLFELKSATLPVGMDLEVQAKRNGERGFRIEYMEIELRSIGSRESVSGVGLAVGKPQLKEWEYKLKFNAEARKGYGILVRPAGTTGAMLIRIAVSNHKGK